MNYELAKKLRDAGFPQKYLNIFNDSCVSHNHDLAHMGNCCGLYAPILEELIEACGDGLEQLWNVSRDEYADGHKWEAHTDGYCMVGLTPSEAVANLWFALNAK